jgi:hypothetical protein
VSPQQGPDARFRQGIEITDDGERLAVTLPGRLDAARQHLEVRATGGALRLDEGAVDPDDEPIRRHR